MPFYLMPISQGPFKASADFATDWVSFNSFGSSKIGQTSLCPTDRLLFLYLFTPVEELQNLPLLVDTFVVLYIYRKTDLWGLP